MRKGEENEVRAASSDPVLTTEDLAGPARPARPAPTAAPAPADWSVDGSVEGSGDRSADGPFERSVGRSADEPVERSVDRPVGVPEPDRTAKDEEEPLLGSAEAERYRTAWGEIQGRFVDDPREAVRSADTLVAEVMQRFAGTLSEHRGGLEKQWDRGEEVATEDLRQALRAYRSLVDRLLAT